MAHKRFGPAQQRVNICFSHKMIGQCVFGQELSRKFINISECSRSFQKTKKGFKKIKKDPEITRREGARK
jgi:hypothetical protein